MLFEPLTISFKDVQYYVATTPVNHTKFLDMVERQLLLFDVC